MTNAAWSTVFEVASAPAPAWRRRLATAVREAADALLVSVTSCPPAYWVRLQHDTVPERLDPIIARIHAEFVPRIERAGESWQFALRRHGLVYAPLDVAQYRELAVELHQAVLAPEGIEGWIVAWFVGRDERLLGFAVVGTREPASESLPRLMAPLTELARRAAATLQGSLDLAEGCGAVVPDLGPERPSLTAREQQIADLVARGYSNVNVGARLGISEQTVGVHLRRIYRKLGVHSRVELAAALERRRESLTR
jgi:DNA-binding CsgD family transcriptional regulator